MLIYGYTQHAGLAENVLDHRLNCRTVYMNWINRYLYWNMDYHVEHHMFPLVPYHALPKLHALVKADMPAAYNGLLEAYREIIPALLRQTKDPTYYVKRQLPTPGIVAAEHGASRVRASSGAVVDGWIEVCDEQLLLVNEDVLRFDHEQGPMPSTVTDDGKFYATDGICTHGNAHLADGLVKGTLIECAKHNGRFDIRDGSPQRLPVCVALKTYPVRESKGKICLDLRAAGGYGVTRAGTRTLSAWSATATSPHSSRNWCWSRCGRIACRTTSPATTCSSTSRLTLSRTLRECGGRRAIIAAVWQAQRVFDLRAANPMPAGAIIRWRPTRPSIKHLRFNVRLATPPRGVDCNAGPARRTSLASSPATGSPPSGHSASSISKRPPREMVYLGGGAGMAPLRSHLSYLLETSRPNAGQLLVRGALAAGALLPGLLRGAGQRAPQFQLPVALSEPQPEDSGTSHTGFIHEVLKREYLDTHPDPKSIDYYLCGPPAMIQAATHMLADLGVDPAQVAFDEF